MGPGDLGNILSQLSSEATAPGKLIFCTIKPVFYYSTNTIVKKLYIYIYIYIAWYRYEFKGTPYGHNTVLS